MRQYERDIELRISDRNSSLEKVNVFFLLYNIVNACS